MERSPNTISAEFKRNAVRAEYDPEKAAHKANVRRNSAKYQGMKIVHHDLLRKEILRRLFDGQSPKAVARRITKREKHLPGISKNAIYGYIASPYGRRIETFRVFRRKRGRTKKRGSKKKLSERTFIDKRPEHINKREKVGDAEGDFIISGKDGKGIVFTVTDRKLRVSFLEKILPVTIPNMERAGQRIKKRYPEWQTMSTDNDLLFEHHKRLEKILGIKIYFCHPYHSWEKGSIENANGVIRLDVIKSSDISKYTRRFIEKVEDRLNRRPMEILDSWTPQELLDRYRRRKRAKDKGKR
jgi:IS30 family transposase